jgi:hypothetical protein
MQRLEMIKTVLGRRSSRLHLSILQCRPRLSVFGIGTGSPVVALNKQQSPILLVQRLEMIKTVLGRRSSRLHLSILQYRPRLSVSGIEKGSPVVALNKQQSPVAALNIQQSPLVAPTRR